MSVITMFLVLFFTFASSIKLLGWQKFIFETQLGFFHKYGLNRQMMFVVGLLELTSSIFLLASFVLNEPHWNLVGALGIAMASLGAMGFHFRYDTFKDAIPSIVTLFLSGTLLYSNSTVIMTLF